MQEETNSEQICSAPNGMAKSDNNHANEKQPLLNDDEESNLLKESKEESADPSPNGYDAISRSSVSTSSSDNELNELWPATFKRSVALLASPTMNVKNIDRMTRSPRIIPHQAEQARITLNKLNRGFFFFFPQKPSKMISSPEPTFKGLQRVHSLDPQRPLSVKDARQIEQDSKMLKAHSYRQKILQKMEVSSKPKQKEISDDQAMYYSPGYRREKDQQKEKKHKESQIDEKKSTFYQSLFNMVNILMGVGLLGLPFVFKSSGWIGGIVVTVVFASITWRTSILIGRELNGDPRPIHLFGSSESGALKRLRAPIMSFPDIAREAFGNNGALAFASVLYFELFSCLAIFLVSLGDHMHALFPSHSVNHHMMVLSVVLAVPTALLRTPRLLSYLSFVGICASIAVVLCVSLAAIFEGDLGPAMELQRGEESLEPYRKMWCTGGLPIAVGLVAYTYSGHALVPSIYLGMENPQQFESMITTSFSIVLGSCFVVAISGYYMFGSLVEDQVTISLENNITNADLAMATLTWLMVLTAFSKFTLTMFPLALGFEEILAPFVKSQGAMEALSSVIKLSLIFLSLMVAIFIPSFSFLCSLVGLICTMIVSVIFPAAAHLKLFGPHLSIADKCLDYFFIICGLVSAILGTYATVGNEF